MADIRSTAAEIRRGKKKEERKKERNYRMKIYMVSLLHRATIINIYNIRTCSVNDLVVNALETTEKYQ